MLEINPMLRLAKTEVRHEHRLTVEDRRACEQKFVHTAEEIQAAITEIAEFDARVTALIKQRNRLLAAAKYVAEHYLQDERDELELCIDQNMQDRIRALFEVVEEVELSL